MTQRNDFLPWATGTGANVVDPTTFGALQERQQGWQNGVALPDHVNTIIRQVSEITSMVANFTATESGDDLVDNGNISALVTSFEKALSVYFQGLTGIVRWGGVSTGTANAQVVSLTPAVIGALPTPCVIFFKAGFSNTGPMTIQTDSRGAASLLKPDSSIFSGSEIVVGGIYCVAWDGATFYLIGGVGQPALVVDAPLGGTGTSANHLRGNSASKTARGFGRVASDAEAVAGVSQSIDTFALPWMTPEQVAAFVSAYAVTGGGGMTSVTSDYPLSGLGTSGSHLTVQTATKLVRGVGRAASDTEASTATSTSIDGTALPWVIPEQMASYVAAHSIASVTVNYPLSGAGTSGSHLVMQLASKTLSGYGRVASDTEAANGASSLTDGVSLPWVTPEQMAAFVAANASSGTSGMTFVTADFPLQGLGTSASHLTIAAASKSTRGYGRVANDSEASAGTSSTIDSFSLPWVTPEQMASYVAAHNGTTVSADSPLLGDGSSGNHLRLQAASNSQRGYGRVANSTEATTGTSSTIDSYALPWMTPEQVFAAVLAHSISSVYVTYPVSGNGTSGSPVAVQKATKLLSGYGRAAGDSEASSGTSSTVDGVNLPWVVPEQMASYVAAHTTAFLTAVTATYPLSGAGTSGSPLVIQKATTTAAGYGRVAQDTEASTATSSTVDGVAHPWVTPEQVAAYFTAHAVSGLTTVAVNYPLSGAGTSGSHLAIQAASKTLSGYGRVASDTEASSGTSSTVDGFNLPWMTPEQVHAAISAAVTGGGGGITSVTADYPLQGLGTSATHLTLQKASKTAAGYGRVASDVEAAAGAAVTTDGVNLPWITPDQMAAYVTANTSTFLTGVTVNYPLSGAGTSASHLAIQTASKTVRGVSRVAGDTEASTGTSATVDGVSLPSITPEQMAAYVAANSIASVSVTYPLSGAGTSGSHVVVQKATNSLAGYGRVANSTEISTATSSTIDGVSTPWMTPEGVATYVAAHTINAVVADAPLSGSGTSGSHLILAAATKGGRGYGRVATDTEATNGTSSTLDSFSLPWMTPEQVASFVSAHALTSVYADLPLQGSGTAGSHLTINQATASQRGYGRVANATEISTGTSLSIDSYATPWMTPEGVATYVATHALANVATSYPLSGNGTSGNPVAIQRASSIQVGYGRVASWAETIAGQEQTVDGMSQPWVVPSAMAAYVANHNTGPLDGVSVGSYQWYQGAPGGGQRAPNELGFAGTWVSRTYGDVDGAIGAGGGDDPTFIYMHLYQRVL